VEPTVRRHDVVTESGTHEHRKVVERVYLWKVVHSLNPELIQVADPVLPYPVDALGRVVAEVSRIKVTAQEKDKFHVRAIFALQLMNLGGFFFAPFVDVGEISRGFGLNENGKADRRR
jgi:hypothetical protein